LTQAKVHENKKKEGKLRGNGKGGLKGKKKKVLPVRGTPGSQGKFAGKRKTGG